MNMDDYYDLLGVDPDAPVADIRAAYREKKTAIAGRDDDDAKADAAALNKAWNVLSDPYQRGRYDQQLAHADETDADEIDGDDDDGDGTVDVPATRTRTRTDSRNGQKGARPPLVPTVKLPAGVTFPTTRARITAMVIDLALLLVLFVGSQVLVVQLQKSNHEAVYDRVTELGNDVIPDARDAANDAKKEASENVDCDTQTTGNDKVYCDAKAEEERLNDELTDKQKVLAPTQQLITGIFFLVALLILLVPSLFGGQTLGKRLQRVRVAKLDGSPAGATELIRRYGALVLAAFALFSLLGPLGPIVVLFVATMWTRNPNRQGLQDRFAKTLVVTGDAQ